MIKIQYEWIHSWRDETFNDDLPRILLVGDSICFGYQEKVREQLKGVCYVDFVATSYAVDSEMYNDFIRNFVSSSEYSLVHFNHGLHGKHLTKEEYKTLLINLLSDVEKHSKIMIATTTFVYDFDKGCEEETWKGKIAERNEAVKEIAKERNYALNDLFVVSKSIPFEKRDSDGTHYKPERYSVFASEIADTVKKVLNI